MQDGNQNEPGWVFKPGSAPEKQEDTPGVGVLAVAAASGKDTSASQPEPAPEPPAPDNNAEQPDMDLPHVEWTASEYIANPKNTGWFMMLAFGSVLVAAAVYFVTQDIVSTAVIGVLGVIVGIFAARQPKVLRYAIDNTGLHIEQKFYPYTTFKAFSVADDQPIHYISLMPLRRFMPPLIVHYAPDDEEKIIGTLTEYLPYEEHKHDMVDNLTRRFRF